MMKSIIGLAAVVTFASSVQAQVANIAAETFAQYGKDEAYWVAQVSCAQGGAKRAIQRKTDGEEWCGKDIAGFCGGNKDDAAKKVCGEQYSSALTDAENKLNAEKEAIAAEQRAKKAEQERAAAQRRQQAQARAKAEREKKAAAAAPLKKKITIEEQLIKIEQEKLDLRRQELELQRRAVEIQSLLEKNKS